MSPTETTAERGGLRRVWAVWRRLTVGIGRLLTLCVLAVVFGVLVGPDDRASRALASALDTHGRWAVARDVRVDVGFHSAKGGGYYAVDAVTVRLPGASAPVPLRLVNGPDIEDHPRAGWQAATKATGYAPPLQVRYRAERGALTAVAKADLNYWARGNHDAEIDDRIALTGAAVAALALVGNWFRPNWRARRAARRPATSRRARHAA